MPNTPTRRQFIHLMPAIGLGFCAASKAQGQDDLLKESDPEAKAINYKADVRKVDRSKFPKVTDDQTCKNCSLYIGDKDAPTGACNLFFGKSVAAIGWCSTWEKK